MQRQQPILVTLLLAILLVGKVMASNADNTITHLLQQQHAPSGVVFEVVSSSATTLQTTLPRINHYIQQLRQRFPQLEIAVVSHGNEQFALQKKYAGKYKKVHSLTQQLVQQHVPVHVCGTYASWKNISEEAFPDYVDVTAEGPATIKDYMALGYVRIKLP